MTSIQMPQLGETIVEGTILKWLKQEGERIEVDEPLFELSTDKVDTEVPSPVSGVVTKILVAEGTTVAVGTALAEVDTGDGPAGRGGAGSAPGRRRRRTIPPRRRSRWLLTRSAPRLQGPPLPPPLRLRSLRSPRAAPVTAVPAPAAPAAPAAPVTVAPAASLPDRGPRSQILSPLVRKLAEEHSLDLSQIAGSGTGGRITKKDVRAAVAAGGTAAPRARRRWLLRPLRPLRRSRLFLRLRWLGWARRSSR